MFDHESIFSYYKHALDNIGNKVLSEQDDYIIGVNVEEYSNYLFDSYSLPIIEKDPSRDMTIEQKRQWEEISISALDITQKTEVTYAHVIYPLVPRERIELVLNLSASTHLFSPPDIDIEYLESENAVLLKVRNPSSDSVRRAVEYLEQLINPKNDDVQRENHALRSQIDSTIRSRKDKISADKLHFEELIKKIDISLKLKSSSQTPIVDLGIKHELKPLVKPTAKRQEEFTLDKQKVLLVIDMIKRIGRSFEVTPAVYTKLEEEDLRSIILATLNTVFEGGATGETFSKKGKTDIHLNIAKGDILIAECKFWKGQSEYSETINQIFRYLTWRQNYGIIITFSRNKDFSSVLEEAKKSVKTHNTFKADLRTLDLTHFESTHTFPEDKYKTVEIHHLFFTLFVDDAA